MTSRQEFPTLDFSRSETMQHMMESMAAFMENQTRLMGGLVAAVEDLKERVARCEVSREDAFQTRLDQLSNLATPEHSKGQERSALGEGLSVRQAAPEDPDDLIDLGHEIQDKLPSEQNIELRRPTPRPRILPLGDSHPAPTPSARPAFSAAPSIKSHSTPLPPSTVRFRETFSFDDPVPESQALTTPILIPSRIKVTPQEYNGKQPWRQYRRHFDAIARISGWSDETKALYLVPFLRGTALSFYDTLSEASRVDFSKLDAAFDARFSNRFEKTVAHIKLRGCVQAPRESLQEFATRVQEYTMLAFEEDPETTREAVALAQFMDGIADMEIQQRVRDTLPEKLEMALALAERIEASREATRICRRQVRVAVADVRRSSPQRPAPTTGRSRGSPRRRMERETPGVRPPAIERGVRGRVRFFLEARKFGFITRSDNGENVFLHRNEIINVPRNAPISLAEGDEVMFDVMRTDRTPTALNVNLQMPSAAPRSSRDRSMPGGAAASTSDGTNSAEDLNRFTLPFRG